MKALVCGIGGQDGAYLARLLLNRGYEVVGTSRDVQSASFSNLDWLGLSSDLQLVSMALTDFRSVISTLKQHCPDEIYNLAGQSSVGLSFDQPVETMESIATGTLNLLEAIRFNDQPVRFYNAGSGECYGHTGDVPANEQTSFRPTSPYAVAKVAAHNLVATYRNAYKLFACTGILFNHESPLRPSRFVTKKIVSAAIQIAGGADQRLELGNIDIVRDWGWAPDYVDAMYRMLQQPTADDYVIATGQSFTLKDLIATAFSYCGLDWTKHVDLKKTLLRPADHHSAKADPQHARDVLGWAATYSMPETVKAMIDAEREKERR